MKHIAGLKYKLGNDRLVWHKVVSADNKTQWVESQQSAILKLVLVFFADFEVRMQISYNSIPKESAVVG